jgi:hypothetical protein
MTSPDSPASSPSGGRGRVAPLPCGRDPVAIVDRDRAGTSDAHERSCPYCQAVIAASQATSGAAAALAAADNLVTVPDTLLPNVMRTVWSELRHSTRIPLPSATGVAFVTDHAVAATVETALDQLADLQVRTCRITFAPSGQPRPPSGIETEVPVPADILQAAAKAVTPTVAVSIVAAVAYQADLTTLADRARAIVGATITTQFGLHAEPIDIDVVDIFIPGGGSR